MHRLIDGNACGATFATKEELAAHLVQSSIHADTTRALLPDIERCQTLRRFEAEQLSQLPAWRICAECGRFDTCQYDQIDGHSYCTRCWVEYLTQGGSIPSDCTSKRICSNSRVHTNGGEPSGAAAQIEHVAQRQGLISSGHLRSILDVPSHPASSSSALAYPQAAATCKEDAKSQPERMEDAMGSELSKLNSQIGSLEGKLKLEDDKFDKAKLARDTKIAEVKDKLVAKTNLLEDRISQLNAKIVQAVADKRHAEEELQNARDRSKCEIESLPEVDDANKLEISRGSIQAELDKMLVKRAEVNSWLAGLSRTASGHHVQL